MFLLEKLYPLIKNGLLKGPFTTDGLQYGNIFSGTWQSVTVPHTWNATDMQVRNDRFTSNEKFYVGDAYYRKTFIPESSWNGKRVFIKFEGVNTNTEVYINNSPMSVKLQKAMWYMMDQR